MAPVAVFCVGMAGSGKTTLMQRLNAHLHGKDEPPYIINLDPAVKNVPFDRNIDIRDSVNYKEVMKQYELGPNGGIMTCLNLFATKIDQVLGILEKRQDDITRILIDTPGQIECFVWSASGAIMTDAIASSFPTVLAYIIDTPRTTSTSTFMSNMLYACSILYKTKLPMIIVFNKTDVQSADFAKEWMADFESFQEALRKEDDDSEGGGGSGYMGSLMNSMSLMLDEFYNHLDVVAVSAMTGAGIDDFFKAVDTKAEEYRKNYLPELQAMKERREQEKEEKRQRELDRMMKDMDFAGSEDRQKKKTATKDEAQTVSDAEEEALEEEIRMAEEQEDEDEEAEEAEADEESRKDVGLIDRYTKAMQDQPSAKSNPEDEASFLRYLRSTNE